MVTISEITAHVINDIPYKSKTGPLTPSGQILHLLQTETSVDIHSRVQKYVSRELSLEQLATGISPTNAYQYLAAAKICDMQKLKEQPSTFALRELCVLKSQPRADRNAINLLNAFTTPPHDLGTPSKFLVNELDNVHPAIRHLPEADQKENTSRMHFYAQEEALVVTEFVPIIEQIIRERFAALKAVSPKLTPRKLIYFAGCAGAGKSHALRLFFAKNLPDVLPMQAVHSTDNIKAHLRHTTGDKFTDCQVFYLAVTINKIMSRVLPVQNNHLSQIQEGWFTPFVVQELFKNNADRAIDIRLFDGDFEAILLRVLSRVNDPNSPALSFVDVVRGYRDNRSAHSGMLQLLRPTDDYSLYYVKRDGSIEERRDRTALESRKDLLDEEIKSAENLIITEAHVARFGESLRAFVGKKAKDALNERKNV